MKKNTLHKVLDSAYDIKWEADKAVGTMKSMESEAPAARVFL